MEQVVVKADGSITTKRLLLLSETDSMNPIKIMELMGFDPLEWQLIKCDSKRIYWDVTMKISTGNARDGFKQYPEKRTNHGYKCEITVKPLASHLNSNQIAKVFERLEAPKLIKYRKRKSGGLLLELPIMDLHLGKLAWKKETGQNYNLSIAIRS